MRPLFTTPYWRHGVPVHGTDLAIQDQLADDVATSRPGARTDLGNIMAEKAWSGRQGLSGCPAWL
jgi:hypothetical protein